MGSQDHPVVRGRVLLRGGWTLDLDAPMRRREEGTETVLFRPGWLVRAAVAANPPGSGRAERARGFRERLPSHVRPVQELESDAFSGFRYGVAGSRGGRSVHHRIAVLVAEGSSVSVDVSFLDAAGEGAALSLLQTLHAPTPQSAARALPPGSAPEPAPAPVPSPVPEAVLMVVPRVVRPRRRRR